MTCYPYDDLARGGGPTQWTCWSAVPEDGPGWADGVHHLERAVAAAPETLRPEAAEEAGTGTGRRHILGQPGEPGPARRPRDERPAARRGQEGVVVAACWKTRSPSAGPVRPREAGLPDRLRGGEPVLLRAAGSRREGGRSASTPGGRSSRACGNWREGTGPGESRHRPGHELHRPGLGDRGHLPRDLRGRGAVRQAIRRQHERLRRGGAVAQLLPQHRHDARVGDRAGHGDVRRAEGVHGRVRVVLHRPARGACSAWSSA